MTSLLCLRARAPKWLQSSALEQHPTGASHQISLPATWMADTGWRRRRGRRICPQCALRALRRSSCLCICHAPPKVTVPHSVKSFRKNKNWRPPPQPRAAVEFSSGCVCLCGRPPPPLTAARRPPSPPPSLPVLQIQRVQQRTLLHQRRRQRRQAEGPAPHC